MWVLFLIFVSVTGQETGFLVEKYDTYEKCHVEEVRIGAEMRLAYHNDPQKFYFKCLTRAKEVA